MENLTSDKVVGLFKEDPKIDKCDFMDSVLQVVFSGEDEKLAYLMSSLEIILLGKGEEKMPLARFLCSELLQKLENRE
jgi:hypothetical protein